MHVEFGIAEFFQTVIPGTGLHPRPPCAKVLKEHFPLIDLETHSSSPLLIAPQTGESFQGIHDRALAFLRLLAAHLRAQHPEVRSVLLVSHAATVIALGRALLGDTAQTREVRAGTCSLSSYRRTGGVDGELGEWECTRNGDTSFLKGGEQRNWHFGMEEEMEEEGIAELVEETVVHLVEAVEGAVEGAKSRL